MMKWTFFVLIAFGLVTICIWRFRKLGTKPITAIYGSWWRNSGNYTYDYNSAACRIPTLLLDDPTLRSYIKHPQPLECDSMANWVFTANGKLYISAAAEKAYAPIACRYRSVSRVDEDNYKESDWNTLANGTTMKHDTNFIRCTGSHGKRYTNVHMGVALQEKLLNRKPQKGYEPYLGYNVLIYIVDSISRLNGLRHLPKVNAVLTQKMGGVTMEGFNIVGDGTPWTLIPILTGKFQLELPEGRRRYSNGEFLDKWPLIFYDFRRAGYVSAFVEEIARYGFFNYKLKGFKVPPADHYNQCFEQVMYANVDQFKYYCLGDTPRALVFNQWWQELQDAYGPKGVKTFGFLFEGEVSHDDYNNIELLDEHYAKIFSDQFDKGYFNDTFLIFMGDHGQRFGSIRQTHSGKMEEKLPYLTLVPPPKFRHQHEGCWENFKLNSKRLVTPFDLYETLQSILSPQKPSCGLGNSENRGISLFEEIPKNRSCKSADIRQHFCSCLDWEELSIKSEQARSVANFVLDELNKAISKAENACVPLTLSTIDRCSKLQSNQQLLQFKESKDFDNINPDLTAEANVNFVTYEIAFGTMPNEARFDASVQYFSESKMYKLSFADISRLNSYSNQPHCLPEKYRYLRPYCICYDMVGKEKIPLLLTHQKSST